MGQQDLSSKVLESHNEIFANIFNTFVFGGKPILEPEYLQDEPTENVFLDNDGNYRNNLRDVFKTYNVAGDGMPVRLAYLGIENQTAIDKAMVVRTLSYTANSYKQQCDNIAIARRAINKQLDNATTDSQKELLQKALNQYSISNLCPTITLILNFSKQKWKQNLTLADLISDSNPFKPYIQNFKIHVVNVLYLSDTEIEELTNDFKALVSFLAKSKTSLEELQYPIDVLMALYAYTNDARFLAKKNYILQKLSKGGKVTMPEILDAYLEKESTKRVIEVAKNLIALGHVSLEEIAECTNLPLETIQELAKQQVA